MKKKILATALAAICGATLLSVAPADAKIGTYQEQGVHNVGDKDMNSIDKKSEQRQQKEDRKRAEREKRDREAQESREKNGWTDIEGARRDAKLEKQRKVEEKRKDDAKAKREAKAEGYTP